jgi:hypothetical protein
MPTTAQVIPLQLYRRMPQQQATDPQHPPRPLTEREHDEQIRINRALADAHGDFACARWSDQAGERRAAANAGRFERAWQRIDRWADEDPLRWFFAGVIVILLLVGSVYIAALRGLLSW